MDLQANDETVASPMWWWRSSAVGHILGQKVPFFFFGGCLFLSFSYISLLSLSLCQCVFFFFLSLLQALVNTNSFCQGICGCVWIETETWEHWACLLLIEYAWLGLPGAVSDERRMKMLMFVELSWILKDLFSLLAPPRQRVHRRINELLWRWNTYLSHI